ncbi:MAG: ABC transporter ATP-binding protein [Paracoccus aminovorans]|nr:ABC transporter ATP-binding protein [Paracoccus aminovorans]
MMHTSLWQDDRTATMVSLDRVSVSYQSFTAVRDVSFEVGAGEFFSLLGPSGCGKTSILRALAGFVEPSAGAIRIDGKPMRGIGSHRRPTALVFQSLALFPTMTVAQNIGYGLRVRGVAPAERRRRVEALLRIVALSEHGDKPIDALSGGQRQRVAIARALAVEPAVLLLDEPLSALDLKLRQRMRDELRAIQRQVGTTFIYITHDQGEALAMSDRVAVMNAGRIEQIGTPQAIYAAPLTPFVAGFVGETNRIAGRVVAADAAEAVLATAHGRLTGRNPRGLVAGDEAALFIRPEHLRLAERAAAGVLSGIAERYVFEGSIGHLHVRTGQGDAVTTLLRPDQSAIPGEHDPVALDFAPADAVVLPVR